MCKIIKLIKCGREVFSTAFLFGKNNKTEYNINGRKYIYLYNKLIKKMDIRNIVHEAVQKTLLEDVTNFNNVINRKNKKLNESNINRMLHWLKNCECAFITAFRKEFKDIRNKDATYFGPNGDWEEGKKFTHEENRQKNKLMVAELLQLGYGVTKIKGVYPEAPETQDAPITDNEDTEESYLVVNRNNDDNFLSNLQRIAEYYNQDSIYYKKAGSEEGHLIGTNACGWPEYHEKGEGSKLHIGTGSNYMSRLGNKAFSFVGPDSERTKDRKDAMERIKKTIGTDDQYRQRDWTDNEGTSFQARKELRKKNLTEAVNFWRNLVNGKMMIKENIHPLTRKTMNEAIRKYKRTH